MKKLSAFIIIGFCALFLLSSCSRLSNITVSKRHYRSGFYVDLGSHKPVVAQREASEPIVSLTARPAEVTTKDQNTLVPSKLPESPLAYRVPADQKKHIAKIYASAQNPSIVNDEIKAERISDQIASMPQFVNPDSKSGASTAPMWVIVLFAILIPPVGVALKFGIIDKFWISLLLTLLFWLPGAIYSLIVVLQ